MYIPPSFKVDDVAKLHDLMLQYSFATLVTSGANGLIASHLPFLIDPCKGPYGTLQCHMARANMQLKDLESGEALVIFEGPHAYVSPSWYATSPSVPTWNYAVVHAYGKPRIVDDPELRQILEATVRQYESALDPPWEMATLTEDYIAKMMRAIAGFEIEITRLEGKYKMSQNRSPEDQARLTEVLERSKLPLDNDVAKVMRSF